MTLQEAIEEVKRTHSGCDFEPKDITDGWRILSERAIATILNAVVKGELIAPEVYQAGDWWDLVDCRHQECTGCAKCEGANQ